MKDEMAYGVHSMPKGLLVGVNGDKGMRFSWKVAVLVVGVSLCGWAQSKPAKPVKMKPSTEFMVKGSGETRSAQAGGPTTRAASNTANKNLQGIERERAKANAHTKKAAAPPPKLDRDKASSRINFTGGGGAKTPGQSKSAQNPYRGRLKEKGAGRK